ncbi:MAG: hypothetical protein GTO53_09900 [Planctomycetales bacterium]|nr:hypothetical protein [Planctomycetales bacterium]NIM09433.1 hypothetical protein [Planctomycetales bacterium]NIN08911.1 hypothetical protein [Planctomycetales bacterium]NIN78029.1 hypothetical protein [Planctomycetales bacterium]NIO35214.1 hypothetical protein [Planctomycetales bacterium]
MVASAYGLCLFVFYTISAATPTVDVELVMGKRAPLTAPQEWGQRLAAAGFRRVSIRGSRPDDQLEIHNAGTAARPIYRVTGYLNEDGSITLPPRDPFTPRDAEGLARWVLDLKLADPIEPTARPSTFGLTPHRLNQVTTDLKKEVRQSTLGADPTQLVKQLAGQLAYPLKADDAARDALREAPPVQDELQGISLGTALAATLRPAGLVMRPQLHEGRLSYAVRDSRDSEEHWPVGWPSSKAPGRLIPGLLQREQTQAIKVSLASAVQELAARIGVPVLWDHNSLARRRIEPQRRLVLIRLKKTHTAALLKEILRQVHMQYEVRLDESDQPFLWLTTFPGL